jgi:hypothetical protein
MPAVKTKETQHLHAYFTEKDFIIDISGDKPDESLNEWIAQFEEDKYRALFHLGFKEKTAWFTPSLDYIYYIAELLIKKISQQPDLEFSRESIQIDLSQDELNQLKEMLPFVIGMEYVNDAWIIRLWENLLNIFRQEIKNYDGTVARYFAEYSANINVVGRVFFHLVENNDEKYPFAFVATYTTKPVKSKRAIHTPLKKALEEFKGDEKKLLSLISTVIKVAEKSEFISGLMESGELFAPLKFTTEEAYIFLKEIGLYEESGIMCRVPDWWRKSSNSIKLSVTVGEKEPSRLGLDAIIDFSPTLKIGDEPLTEKELRAFLEMAEGLVQYKGKWVEINKSRIISNAFPPLLILQYSKKAII